MFKVNIRKSGLAANTSLSTSLANAALPSIRKPRVKVGFPAGEVDSKMVMRAYFNEFGTKGSGKGFKAIGKGGKTMGGFGGPVPERPFMRNAMKSNQSKYKDAMAAAARKMMAGENWKSGMANPPDMRLVLSKLGAMAVDDIRAEITSLSSPPNSPITIALKGSSNPLIDTGQMRTAVTWKVDD